MAASRCPSADTILHFKLDPLTARICRDLLGAPGGGIPVIRAPTFLTKTD
jgi:hypothetical protein